MSERAHQTAPETPERPSRHGGSDVAVFHATVRAAVAFLCLGAWLGLLLFGWTAGGVVHALLVLGAVLFPWRWLAVGTRGDDPR